MSAREAVAQHLYERSARRLVMHQPPSMWDQLPDSARAGWITDADELLSLLRSRPDLVAEITGDEPRETVYWLLQRLGWTKTSETGRYEVWQRGTKRADEAMVLVPTDRSAMDYGYMMHRAEAALRTEFALLPMRAHEAQRADQ